jgi:hypothetical protein
MNLNWIADLIEKKSQPFLDATPYAIFSGLIILPLVIAFGKRENERDGFFLKRFRSLGRSAALSGAYTLAIVSGLLFGVGVSYKITSSYFLTPYVFVGVVGLALSLVPYCLAVHVTDEMRRLVGILEPIKKRRARYALVSFSLFAFVQLLYHAYSEHAT